MNLSRSAVLIIALLTPLAAFAQDVLGLASRLEEARYPLLAFQARIQGDVKLRSGTDGVTVISGHPLLAAAAVSNLKELGKFSNHDIEAIYHFGFINCEMRSTTRVEKKGNRLERLVLRAFMMKTERVVQGTECIEDPTPPKNRVEVTESRIEVWIYRSIPGLLMTSTDQIALR
jgi:hypothetical protein